MNINRSSLSPNFDDIELNVEFIVIHYTACSLQSTLDIFANKERKVSSHIVVAEDGAVYEVVKCWDKTVNRAWHAGKSIFNDGKKEWRDFNDFSIGIEIVNLNGNVFEYTDEQYEAVINCISHFKERFKSLQNPERIIGHEQIAKSRGKVDPGWKFNWEKIYQACYPGMTYPKREANLLPALRESTDKLLSNIPESKEKEIQFWQTLNTTMEAASKLSQT